MACLFNFLLWNSVALKWVIINHSGFAHHVSCQGVVQCFCANVDVCGNDTERQYSMCKEKNERGQIGQVTTWVHVCKLCQFVFAWACVCVFMFWICALTASVSESTHAALHLSGYKHVMVYKCVRSPGCVCSCASVHVWVHIAVANTSQVPLGGLERLQCMSFNVTKIMKI